MTKMSAVLGQKCPRCRKGKLFASSALSFKYAKMNEECSCCRLRYEIEPGFFYAAMYVSYVLVVAELVTAAILAFYFIDERNQGMIIALTILPALLLSKFNFRYSRTLLLHFLSPIKFRPGYECEE